MLGRVFRCAFVVLLGFSASICSANEPVVLNRACTPWVPGVPYPVDTQPHLCQTLDAGEPIPPGDWERSRISQPRRAEAEGRWFLLIDRLQRFVAMALTIIR